MTTQPPKWVCKYCIAAHGLRGDDLANWPDMNNQEAQMRHIESEHHIAVCREDETMEQAHIRFHANYPEAGGPNCKCPRCVKSANMHTEQA